MSGEKNQVLENMKTRRSIRKVFPAPCFHVSSGFDKTKRYSRLRKYRVIMYNLHAELILRTTEISACPKRQFLPVRTAERQRSFIRSFIQYGTV